MERVSVFHPASARARSAADIPRLIHQFTHLPDDDSKAHGLLRTEARVRAVHRGWCVRYWDDDELAAFVNASFAGAVADAYFKFPPGVIRSDIARYLLVATYGGWYLDTDIKCSQPLDTLHGRGGVVLTRTAPNPRKPPRPDFRPLVANFVFGSAPDHPFWELVLDEVASLPDPPREGLHDHLDIAMLSGPGLMQRAWARLGEAASATLGVVLEENARLGAWRSPIEKAVWDPYKNQRNVTAVCVHYNLFSWKKAGSGASSTTLETRTKITPEENERRKRARREWICSGGSDAAICRSHGSDESPPTTDDPAPPLSAEDPWEDPLSTTDDPPEGPWDDPPPPLSAAAPPAPPGEDGAPDRSYVLVVAVLVVVIMGAAAFRAPRHSPHVHGPVSVL